jgi:hypothetical protein
VAQEYSERPCHFENNKEIVFAMSSNLTPIFVSILREGIDQGKRHSLEAQCHKEPNKHRIDSSS